VRFKKMIWRPKPNQKEGTMKTLNKILVWAVVWVVCGVFNWYVYAEDSGGRDISVGSVSFTPETGWSIGAFGLDPEDASLDLSDLAAAAEKNAKSVERNRKNGRKSERPRKDTGDEE
jgi:hypothetical protein